MKCPQCKEIDTKVIDSRFVAASDTIRRRRHCPQCGARFTTRENLEIHYPRVVKRSGVRCQFDETKIVRGLNRACEKRNIDAQQIEEVVLRVKESVMTTAQGDEITSEAIGALVIKELSQLDEVAYIRFASVYKSFSDIFSFQKIIEDLKQHKKQEELV